MANHIDKQLRAAVVTTLTGLSTSGANVFDSRLDPLQASEIPALRISTNGEQVDVQNVGFPVRQVRTVDLVIECVVRQSSGVADTLATMRKEVETALNASLSAYQAGGVARGGIDLVGVEVAKSGEGELDCAVATMSFKATCYTYSNAPDTAI